MRALVVVAHPEPVSFTWAMAHAAATALRDDDVEVEFSDLYGENFDPTASRSDFTTVADPDRFHYQTEQQYASRNDGFSAELQREQMRVERADLLIFLFPIWWGAVPAILKGWFDRVLAYGFAYEDGMRYETGYFAGRTGLLGVSTGGTKARFSESGAYGTIDQVLWPTQHCMIEYMGLSAAAPFVAYASPRVSAEEREAYLREWAVRVRKAVQMQRETVTCRRRPLASSTDWTGRSR
ncbi:NAD(P)H-dependent oxidoreductase [Mycetocola sp.]|uniref:NAD(P)H-dependent oxidoreductase n=1 Tax=Mycetocola sp. TaxID=1871042 RepID=UPI003989077B